MDLKENKIFQPIIEEFRNKNIVIAGFGREGRSTYALLRKILPEQQFTIADQNKALQDDTHLKQDKLLKFKCGEDYLENLNEFDFVIKTPGISTLQLGDIAKHKITSQTDLFLSIFARNVIGITGTKGKSTTTVLIYNLLKSVDANTVLVGNIGVPPFERLNEINEETRIVCELSSHQLEYLHTAPHISILLNIYKEHLDHYESYREYQAAKFNITLKQHTSDYFIYNADNELIESWIKETGIERNFYPFSAERALSNGAYIGKDYLYADYEPYYNLNSPRHLKGNHNLLNIAAMIQVARILQINPDAVLQTIADFQGLEHRLELVGTYKGITFYNDSISTIPEAAIQAVEALQMVDTLILGGFDRGIDYGILASFLQQSTVRNLIFLGKAGQRIYAELEAVGCQDKKCYFPEQFKEAVQIAFNETMQGKICLLSPAAASYDSFKNFEERGQIYKELVRSL